MCFAKLKECTDNKFINRPMTKIMEVCVLGSVTVITVKAFSLAV